MVVEPFDLAHPVGHSGGEPGLAFGVVEAARADERRELYRRGVRVSSHEGDEAFVELDAVIVRGRQNKSAVAELDGFGRVVGDRIALGVGAPSSKTEPYGE